jgi:quercetin dioxygenase-like cupin family protein
MTTARHTYLRTHAISGKVLTFDLRDDAADLIERARESKAGRVGRTLVKEGPLRIALVALAKGVSLKEHEVAGAVSVHVVRGRVRLEAADRQLRLRPGQLVALDAEVRHGVSGVSDCAILITMSVR